MIKDAIYRFPNEQRGYYLSDLLPTISYLCSNTLEKQILVYE
jgi:hypothetical protein